MRSLSIGILLVLTGVLLQVADQVIADDEVNQGLMCSFFSMCWSSNEVNETEESTTNTDDEKPVEFFKFALINSSLIQQPIDIDLASLEYSEVNPLLSTIVITHGYYENCSLWWVYEMAEELLKYDNFNLFCVDWKEGARLGFTESAQFTNEAADEVVRFLSHLETKFTIDRDSVHLIGFSFGAHLFGIAGHKIKEIGSMKSIGRITGLDPASFHFEGKPSYQRLDRTSASYVDVIHTDTLTFYPFYSIGYREPLGHFDFYPNGGYNQPGCNHVVIEQGFVSWWSGVNKVDSYCNHRRALGLFTSSIKSSFHSFPCHDFDTFQKGKCFNTSQAALMGFHSQQTGAVGVYYLLTTERKPWSGHQYRIELKLSKNSLFDAFQIKLINSEGMTVEFAVSSHIISQVFATEFSIEEGKVIAVVTSTRHLSLNVSPSSGQDSMKEVSITSTNGKKFFICISETSLRVNFIFSVILQVKYCQQNHLVQTQNNLISKCLKSLITNKTAMSYIKDCYNVQSITERSQTVNLKDHLLKGTE